MLINDAQKELKLVDVQKMKKNIKGKRYALDQYYSAVKKFYDLIKNANLVVKEEKMYGNDLKSVII